MRVSSHLSVLVRRAGLWLVLGGLTFAASSSVTLRNVDNEKIAISIDGASYSDFYIGSKYPKPFLEPLRTVHGYVVTRRWPTAGSGAGESHDHQHHRGLWIGYGSISGINFWENEYDYKPPNRGTIVLEKIDELRSGGHEGTIKAHFVWKDPGGAPMLREERTTVVRADSDLRIADVDSALTAARDIHFDDTKEGFFAVRLADTLAGKNGGLLTNSSGANGEKAVWGKRADWVVDSGTVDTPDGKKAVQVVILDHPSNPNHPPRWHARDYGLFAINPFGLKDFAPQSTEPGGRSVAAGETLRFRYRVIVAEGEVKPEQIAHWYAEFSAQ
jgi:hypothetical protein